MKKIRAERTAALGYPTQRPAALKGQNETRSRHLNAGSALARALRWGENPLPHGLVLHRYDLFRPCRAFLVLGEPTQGGAALCPGLICVGPCRAKLVSGPERLKGQNETRSRHLNAGSALARVLRWARIHGHMASSSIATTCFALAGLSWCYGSQPRAALPPVPEGRHSQIKTAVAETEISRTMASLAPGRALAVGAPAGGPGSLLMIFCVPGSTGRRTRSRPQAS